MKIALILIAISMVFVWFAMANAREIGFIEDFSLSKDRSETLKQLIPGTEEYYYYTCLDAQNTGNYKRVYEMVDLWIKRYGYTAGVKEIQNRQALLEYDKSPKKSLNYIIQELNLRFDHAKEETETQSDLPSTLDASIIDTNRLIDDMFSRYDNLNGIEDEGLDRLPHNRLDPDRRRDFLGRLARPDIPGLAKLVIDDLTYRHSGGFGSHRIHNLMLKSQLDECKQLMPELMNNSAFINAYIAKLAPSDDADIRYDRAERKAFLDRQWAFVKPLSSIHNSLKAHVLYHLLDDHRSQGNYDRALFMEYIRLPRNAHYMNPDYLRRKDMRDVQANMNVDFKSATYLDIVGSDEGLLRDYLSTFFIDANDYSDYVEFIRDDYLKAIFVETKIVNGLGDAEKWYSLMDPRTYQTLKERVDLDFTPINPKFFGMDESVRLELDVKNVKTLIVKIFQLNPFNYYRSNLQEIDTSVNLDGLVPTHEKVETYDESPLRRVRRAFDFPQIQNPGLYVVEFIGSGMSSRALIRKGRLYYVDKIGPSAHELIILDEKNQPHPHASIWITGREFKPDETGTIMIPFSTHPGSTPIILKDGELCSLATLEHQSEQYNLVCGFYVDRESLLKRMTAQIIVRPVLTLNDHPVSLTLLENVRLTIESISRDGMVSSKEVAPFELFENRESVFDFQVPENLAKIKFSLKAKVQNLSRNKKEDLTDSTEVALNDIDQSLWVEDIFLSRSNDGYCLELRGRNGEPKTNRSVRLEFKNRYIKDIVHVVLQTDLIGTIYLGNLSDILWVKATTPDNISHTWNLTQDLCHYPKNLHGQAKQTLRIPYMGKGDGEKRLHYSLLERRAQTYLADQSESVRIRDGFLEIENPNAGDYDLFLKESNTTLRIKLTHSDNAFSKEQGIIAGRRALEVKADNPLQIRSIDVANKEITVKLGYGKPTPPGDHPFEFTRVHVIAMRFLPNFHPYAYLNRYTLPEPYAIQLTLPESQYIAGRNIGDEYRYILDRKYADKFPGNMLSRPELLLNPWSIRKTETAVDQAKAGESYAAKALGGDYRMEIDKQERAFQMAMDNFSSMDFMKESSVVFLNIQPDENGVVTLDRGRIGGHSQLHVLALDPVHTVYRTATLPRQTPQTRDLRLIKSLDPEKHFTEQKQISTVHTKETFSLTDIATTEFETYDSLDKIYRLLVTLTQNSTLEEFGFVCRWHDMNPEEKEKKYSEYACHELSLFLFHKDKPFFDTVILPYLKNKKEKTFIDLWLLDEDLTSYLEPWQFSQLNIVEQILLSRRFPGEWDNISRNIKDRFEMIPPDPDTFNRLFDMALRGRDLEEDDGFGLGDELMAPAEVREDSYELEEPTFLSKSMRVSKPSMSRAMEADAMPMPAAPKAQAMEMKMEGAGRIAKQGYYKPRDAGKAQEHRKFYQQLDKTMEWAENNYYKVPFESQNADLISVNAFWNDFAVSDPKQPFYSGNFIYATNNFSEVMLALAVLDVPIRAEKHETGVKDAGLWIKAGSPMIVFHKTIEVGKPTDEKIPILASQNVFMSNDRYRYVGNDRFDKFIEDECLIRVPYGCQVVLSNPTSSLYKFRILMQIPKGAMPLNNGFYTRGVPVTLQPFATQTFEYHFYFPETGNFWHYPVQVTQNERFVAGADAMELKAVTRLSKIDTESWDYISQNGSESDVLEFMSTHNLNRLNLDKIAFRMKTKRFFEKTIRLLEERHHYQDTLYLYGIHHNDRKVISEYLKHSDFANRCGSYIQTSLLTIDPIDRKEYEHREYKPLVNARAHQLGKSRKILNDRFYDHYQQFLKILSCHPKLNEEDIIAAVYYLLLQDRVADALELFGRIDGDRYETRMQVDYLRAYFAFYLENSKEARTIAKPYENYPVPKWRDRFRQVLSQLDELEGKGVDIVDEESRDQVQTRLAATEPSIDFNIEARKITVQYQNLTSCQLNYYLMDIELLFSKNPFIKQQTDYFTYIQPNEIAQLTLPENETSLTIDLPEPFHNSNLMVEISSAGIRKFQVYYANSLNVQVIENYGHLKVAHQKTRKPLVKVYVKVYARMNDGTVQFFKDGYTDIRGRFDYTSINTNELDHAEKLAILILSEEYGATIREAAPPKQ